jgi:hypothetical protein
MVDSDLNVLGPRETPVVSLTSSFSSTEPFGSQLRSLIDQYGSLFQPIDMVLTRQQTIEYLIDTADAKPVHQNVCQMSLILLAELKERLQKLQTSRFI